MTNATLQTALLRVCGAAYTHIARPLVFRQGAGAAHEQMLTLLRRLDEQPAALAGLRQARAALFPREETAVGGVTLPGPLMLAAGLVKGDGFESEAAAAHAARSRNIMPGWRSVQALVGPVEFGSFTRWPRAGNRGEVIWRDAATQSTQNRIGLKNPGIRAAAQFLGARLDDLPPVFGVNIAPSPGADDETAREEVLEALTLLFETGVRPTWLTLNLSCPNTEDDPGARQTEVAARALCRAAVDVLAGYDIPLWVKLGPDLSGEQYRALMRAFADTGVRAVIATNTLPRRAPNSAATVAGVGGGWLRPYALPVVRLLAEERARHGYPVDVIACGGVLDGATLNAYRQAGAQGFQYWSALVYRGPLAAAVIPMEAHATREDCHDH